MVELVICGIAVVLICYETCSLMDSDVGGGGSKHPVSCMMVGADTREVGENDEVSVVSDDRGDGEINKKWKCVAKIRSLSAELL